LWCLVALGCAQRANETTEDAIGIAEPAAAATTPVAANEVVTPELPSAAATVTDSADSSIAEPSVATEPARAPPSVAPGEISLEAAEAAVVATAAPTTPEFEPALGLIAPSVGSPAFVETLDFSSLVARLRRTKAINLRTKVAVKNESDELLEQFRTYHTQHGIVTLADLRRSYDSLFHRLHSLLQDADPPLARDIDRSQAAIWEVLADPRKFRASGMAGA
jgi:hypothetical protein